MLPCSSVLGVRDSPAADGSNRYAWPVQATLQQALEAQYDGSYRQAHHGASGYNEVRCKQDRGAAAARSSAAPLQRKRCVWAARRQIIIGSLWWEANLPFAVEAFVFTDDSQHAPMKQHHRNFLLRFGLTPEEVPLLRFECADPNWPSGSDCFRFQDVSDPDVLETES